jgi:hypothetical protein
VNVKYVIVYYSVRYMKQNPSAKMPIPAARALRKLGHDMRDARLRRRIPTAIMSQRALVTRTTLHKVEKGDPTVSMGTYTTVLFVLGMTERLAELADARFDRLGLVLEEERLPKRIRSAARRSKKG